MDNTIIGDNETSFFEIYGAAQNKYLRIQHLGFEDFAGAGEEKRDRVLWKGYITIT
ncbi:hypothetical protein [Mucilaginibacter sp. SP1R1]|uniref:hypothetical protein n=1 Tax=Mucilaginibacter sp. SP1R1 TaxID=2723091 RepID=UPI00161B0082|nr:hypothetical protein [Mucilaginibacter sp. SP1R1]MBB6148396.1 hypothetical protein [Mucilaginibacter sp. SP1R1]